MINCKIKSLIIKNFSKTFNLKKKILYNDNRALKLFYTRHKALKRAKQNVTHFVKIISRH